MSDSGRLEKLQKWMEKNRSGLISNPGNKGNGVTTCLYNIINNNNINIIDRPNWGTEAVTPDHLSGVTGVTEKGEFGDAPFDNELLLLPDEKIAGNVFISTISNRLPLLPVLPAFFGKGEADPERTFLSGFLSWMDAEAGQWPRETRELMTRIREWFQGQGYRDPADLILAFVTVQELMYRKGGPVVLAPEAAGLERLAREVFGEGVLVYWLPERAGKYLY